MRTEIALRNGRILDALLWTYSFLDAAMIDGIARLPFVLELDPMSRTCRLRPGFIPPADLQEGGVLKSRSGDWWNYFTGRKFDHLWYRQMGAYGDDLVALRDALQVPICVTPPGKREWSVPLSEARNVAVHGALPPHVLERVEHILTETGIWANADSGGHRFLDQPYVSRLTRTARSSASEGFSALVNGMTAAISAYSTVVEK
jgi:hypothetical protein